MSQQPPQRPQQQGQYGKGPDGCEPPPPPPCPDPCDGKPPWGPPTIPAECCPPERDCCAKKKKKEEGAPADEPEAEALRCCTWDQVDDPCVRAAAASDVKWTKLSCECKSSNEDEECKCKEWDCGPGGCRCVPCKPCEGVIPPDDGGSDKPPDPCEDPNGPCDTEGLQRQLDSLKRCIVSQQTKKTAIEADIKARQEREKELAALVTVFDTIVEKYRSERYKLRCREDCLKGFERDVSTRLTQEYSDECLKAIQTAINEELVRLELTRCCKVNLEEKLSRSTRLVWEQKDAEKSLKKAEDAFAAIKDLPKWMGDRFGKLEALKDEIAAALNDKDPKRHRWAFYLFYWRFVPQLCGCSPLVVCCCTAQAADAPAQAARSETEERKPHVGCEPGDWHPSRISEDDLKQLICCAWDYARNRKEELQKKTAALEAAGRNLDFVKKKVDEDAKSLEDRIKGRIEKVECATPPAVAEGGHSNA